MHGKTFACLRIWIHIRLTQKKNCTPIDLCLIYLYRDMREIINNAPMDTPYKQNIN